RDVFRVEEGDFQVQPALLRALDRDQEVERFDGGDVAESDVRILGLYRPCRQGDGGACERQSARRDDSASHWLLPPFAVVVPCAVRAMPVPIGGLVRLTMPIGQPTALTGCTRRR